MTLMRGLLLPLSLLAAAGLIVAPGATHPAVHHRHAPIDWTRTVTATPEGGFRIGNPQAKVAVVEFMSFTCPHCGAFAAEGFPAIRDKYVRTGKVSFEMRSALRDRADLVAATLADCGGPQHYFPLAEALFAAQADWETRAIDYDSGHPPVEGAAVGPEMAAFASGAGMDAIAKQHGVSPAAQAHCFADDGIRANLTKTTADAWSTRKIGGTPAFLINGKIAADVHAWVMLEPLLQAAING